MHLRDEGLRVCVHSEGGPVVEQNAKPHCGTVQFELGCALACTQVVSKHTSVYTAKHRVREGHVACECIAYA